MADNFIFTAIIVFLVVFLPYLIFQMVLNPASLTGNSPDGRNLPPVFKMIWKILVYSADAMNPLAELLSPELQGKLLNTLKVANIRMCLQHLLAASVFLSAFLTLVSVLLFLCFTTDGGVLAAVAVIAAVIGLMYPFTKIQDLAQKRQLQIMRSLPFAIDLIGSAIRSGVDFIAAIRYYISSENEKNPLAVEFGVMLRQLELGKTRSEAVEDMASRIQTEAFSAFAGAVSHSFEAGTSIIDTMKIQAAEMRRERFNIAERKAAKAASSMIFPIAVFIMPAMVLIIAAPIVIQVFKSGLGDVMK